jgi:ABC-type nitrate/sulfonate/bicarbonate transport system permease component
MFTTIALPGALPFIMTGVKLGAGMGLILIAIAEMIGAQSGLGFMIWNAWQILSVNTMYVGLIMIAILGFALTLILNEVERSSSPRAKTADCHPELVDGAAAIAVAAWRSLVL